MVKKTIPVDKRGRMTIPDEFKKYLGLSEDDDVWMEKTKDGKLIIGRVEVKRKIIN